MTRDEWREHLRYLSTGSPIARAWAAVTANKLTVIWLNEDLEALA